MSKFTEGMKVQIIGCDNELLTGTIELLSDDVAIVQANNETRYKRGFDEIAILKETESIEVEQPEEPNEKTEVTITKRDLIILCAEICEEYRINQSLGVALICSDFSIDLKKKLFSESPEK